MSRKIVQWLSLLLHNAYLPGLFQGRLYSGPGKYICVPGLNCYSCPAAIGACPLGALQTILASSRYSISCYVTGTLFIYGVLLGRYICGWLCPFGLIQELLHKIPSPNYSIPRWAGYTKYLLMLLLVIALPLFLVNPLGMGEPTYCKYICPAGTLEGGVPLLALHPSLRDAAGQLFIFKLFLLLLVIGGSIISFRPFCKILCPLGAIYGLFNPISIYRYQLDDEQCIACGQCAQNCRMGVAMYKEVNSPECIRCGDCRDVCPTGAITPVFKLGTGDKEIAES